MTIELYLAFVAATAVLIAIPGPNVAVIVATSIAHGRRFGLVTVAGTSAAMIPARRAYPSARGRPKNVGEAEDDGTGIAANVIVLVTIRPSTVTAPEEGVAV